jgi:hypothetical protein
LFISRLPGDCKEIAKQGSGEHEGNRPHRSFAPLGGCSW